MKNDVLDYLSRMQEEIDLAIIATSQGDELSCIDHIGNIEEELLECKHFYNERRGETINKILDGKD